MACCQVSCATAVGEGRPYATRVVAAVDSVATDAINADFVCDGINDEVTIRQAFLSLAEDLGGGSYLYNGGKVVLLEGNYYCSEVINLDFTGEPFSTIPPAWFTLEGMGFGTKLIFTPAPLASHGIDVITPTQIKGFILRDLRIFDPGNTAVHIDNAQVALIERVATIGGQFGLDIENGALTRITDCWIEGAADTCIRVTGQATIDGNSINLDADNTTINYSERGIAVNSEKSIVSNNRIFRAASNQQFLGWSDILVAARAQVNGPASSTAQAAIRIGAAYNMVVNNSIYNLPNHRPIDASGGSGVISGNAIENCDWGARNLPASSPAINAPGSNYVVTGNHLQNLGQMGGILVGDNCVVSNNVMVGVAGHGIYLDGSRAICVGNTLNDVAEQTGGGDGITVTGTLNQVKDNYVLANRTADAGSFGINVTGSRNIIQGNGVTQTKREAIYVTGSQNLIDGNTTSRIAATHIAVPAGAGGNNHLTNNKCHYEAAGPGGVNAPRAILTGAVLPSVVVGNNAIDGPWAIDVNGYNLIAGTLDTFAAGVGPGDNF